MKNARTHNKADSGALDKRKFIGTNNPRYRRALDALLNGPVTRHDLARIAGAANAPELVAELRRRGLNIPCERIDFIDRDGDKCRPGEYHLTDDDHRMVSDWLKSEGQ